MQDSILGMRFDTGRMGNIPPAGVSEQAWRILWGAVGQGGLRETSPADGEAATSLAGAPNVFCIALRGQPATLAWLQQALWASAEFRQVAADPPFASMTAPPRRRRALLAVWLIVGLLVVAAAVAVPLLLTGGGQLASKEDVEAQVRALAGNVELRAIGDPTVTSVSCPESLPEEPNRTFECSLGLSSGDEAKFEVAFVDEDGKLGWCLFSSQGFFVLNAGNLTGDGNACSDPGRPSSAEPSSDVATSPVPVPVPTTLAEPAPAPAVEGAVVTAAGPLTIEDVRTVSRWPVGCKTSDQSCLTSSGARILVVEVHAAPGQVAEQTMNAVTTEFFQSTVDDGTTTVPATQTHATHGTDTFDLIYAQLSDPDPETLTLTWPGSDPIQLPTP